MTAPTLILAVGNESRGDDALGPLLLRRLRGGSPAECELLEDFQLQIEHAADLVERERVLFVDAGMDTPAPYSFHRVQPDDGRTAFSHALTPQAVLATYAQVYGSAPPPAFVLCLRGERFELGEPLSSAAEAHLDAAAEFARQLLRPPDTTAWERYAASPRRS